MMRIYKTLNDARFRNSIFAEGDIQVWYTRGNFVLGLRPIDKENLSETHAHLGDIAGNDSDDVEEKIFRELQGCRWSPNGEAFKLIKAKGLWHTSMSIGDILVIKDKIYVCKSYGFEII